MSQFVVSARKYRPQSFRDVVGQQAITNTLLNAIENNHLAQALLFTGPRGVGKTTCARILAKKINEQSGVTDDNDFAFNVFELDAASNNSVDDIRKLIEQVRIPPQVGNYKVYIIDEVHMLSTAAFNAFLKTLEEPPKHAIFILATTEKHKIIPTILSRCQIFDFKRITISDIREYLKYIAEQQGIEAEDEALQIIAQKADGAMRDALSIFDRVVSFSGDKITRQATSEILNVLDYEVYFKVTDLILDNKLPDLLLELNTVIAQGFDGNHFIAGLASHFRDLMVCKNKATISLMEVGEETRKKYTEQSERATVPFLMEAIRIANDCDLSYRNSKNQRLLVEIALMQLASLTYEGDKKKNDGRFIIPAYLFNVEVAPVATQSPPPAPAPTPVVSVPTITKAQRSGVVSGFSIKSVHLKTEHQRQAKEDTIDPNSLPREPFTSEAFQQYWQAYIQHLLSRGERLQASILQIANKQLEGTVLHLEVGTQTAKTDVIEMEPKLLAYLHKQLRNYDLKIEIQVNEEISKRILVTPEEKYNRLLQLNPLLQDFRNAFSLAIS